MSYNLGIDIGIASVGFAGVAINEKKILFCNAHIFEAAEHPKNGASLALPRREKRGTRRVIRRKAVRKNAIRNLLKNHGLDTSTIDLPENAPAHKSVWDLRKEAMSRPLSDTEFARVLFHIAKHRGADYSYNSNKALTNDLESQKTKKAAFELEEQMVRAGAKTIGAYLATKPKKRNGNGSYENFVTRDLLRHEVNKIFEKQQKLGNIKATKSLLEAYAGNRKPEDKRTVGGEGLAFYQRPLASSEHMVGECTLEKGEKRAPKMSYSAELFILWSKLNHTKIKDIKGGERFLTQDEKNRLCEKAHSLKSFSYAQARKELKLLDEERFNLSYRATKGKFEDWDTIRKNTEKVAFLKLDGYHALKTALDTGSQDDWQKWVGPQRAKLNEIARILSFYEDPVQVDDMLAALDLDEAQRKNLTNTISFSKTVNLSLKAIDKILPSLEQGMTYDKACMQAGYDHSRKENKGLKKVPVFEDTNNPVVNRALAQTRKVINAIIRQYGMPETMIIELARDVGKNFKDRKTIERDQKANQNSRDEAKNHMAEILDCAAENIKGGDVLKYRLWQEQKHICPYTGVVITPNMLRDSTATQIDHILPYGRSWNDSYMNKVLCLTSANQDKGNRTPFEYLGNTPNWAAVEDLAKQLPPKKRDNLLLENFDSDKENQWKDRALNDTRYMARLLKNHLEENLKLGTGNRVQTRNGALTAHLRGAWGFPDKDRRNDRHHALDAIVLACSTQSHVQELTTWNKYEAQKKNPGTRTYPPKPWESFREDVKQAINTLFVSRMPVRKITGAAHEDTIRSIRYTPDGTRQIIQRVQLTALTLEKLENIVDKKRNQKVYDLLKARLDDKDGNAVKAFAEPIFMPVNDKTKIAPQIKSIQILTSEKSGVEINQGLASNGDQIRVDIFKKNNKFFAVPIYAHQFATGELPNKAIIQSKDEAEWEAMNDEDFLFSLYKNDLVFIKDKKQEYFAYYNGIHRGTGSITIRTHDRDPSFGKEGTSTTGIKALLGFEKYIVDYFGNKSKTLKEKRHGVAHNHASKSGEVAAEAGATTA